MLLEGPMNATEARNIEVVRKYYDGCNSGDIDEMMSTFAPDVTHYFLPSELAPIRGAEALAKNWKWWKDKLDSVFHMIICSPMGTRSCPNSAASSPRPGRTNG
jgi:ketosteroid isomerase-like protein